MTELAIVKLELANNLEGKDDEKHLAKRHLMRPSYGALGNCTAHDGMAFGIDKQADTHYVNRPT